MPSPRIVSDSAAHRRSPRRGRRLGACLALAAVCALALLGAARPSAEGPIRAPAVAAPLDTTERDTASRRAQVQGDSFMARIDEQGRRVRVLVGNVRGRQDSTRFRSHRAFQYPDERRYVFIDSVVIVERGDTLTADTVRYDGRTKVGRATGRVALTDGEVTVLAPSATYFTRNKRATFTDGVTLVDSASVLASRRGVYLSDAQRADFVGDVRLRELSSFLAADSVVAFRKEGRTLAFGRVYIHRYGDDTTAAPAEASRPDTTARIDTTAQTLLFGLRARAEDADDLSEIEGDALLVQLRTDTTDGTVDTLAIRARRLLARRLDAQALAATRRAARVPPNSARADSVQIDSVQIGSVQANVTQIDTTRADTMSLDKDGEKEARTKKTPPRTAVTSRIEVPPEGEVRRLTAVGDVRIWQPRLASTADSSVYDRLLVPDTMADGSTDEAPLRLVREETRLFASPSVWFDRTQVTGERMRIAARERSVDTVFVVGRGFAVSEDSATGRLNQLKGRTLTAFFRKDSLRRFVATPNGEIVYFRTDDAGRPNGAIEASGDRFVAWFRGGDIDSAKVYTGIQQTYYAESIVPQPLRLDGFVWTPAARPTEAAVLDARARRRLAAPGRPLPAPTRQIPLDSLRPEVVLPPPDTAAAVPPIPDADADLTRWPPPRRTTPPADTTRIDTTRTDTSRADTVRADPTQVDTTRADSLARRTPERPNAARAPTPADSSAAAVRPDTTAARRERRKRSA